MAPLVDEMLQRIAAEVARYERVITYWPVFGPALEGAVCASLRETTASVTRQCGLAQVAFHSCHPLLIMFECDGVRLPGHVVLREAGRGQS